MKTAGRRGRKPYITLILFVLLAAALLGAAVPLQRRISERLGVLKEESVAYLEAVFNRTISYDSIAPSILRCIEIRGLNIHRNGGSGEPLLHLNRIRVFYRLGELLRGGGENLIREVRIENSTLTVDMAKDRDLIEFLTPDGTGAASYPDINISGRNLTLELTSDGNTLLLNKVFFDLEPDGGMLHIDAKLHGSALLMPAVFGVDAVEAGIRINGSLDRDFGSSSLRVRLSNLLSPAFEMRAITLQAEHEDTRVTVRKIQDKAPFDILVSYNTRSEDARLRFSAEDFIPYTYLTPGEQLAGIAPWFTSVISGRAEVLYSLGQKDLFYDADLSLRLDNRLLPEVFLVDVICSGDTSTLSCRNLSVSSAYGQWGFRGSVAFDGPFPVPQGTLRVRNVPLGDEVIHSVMTITRKDPYVSVHSTETDIGGIRLRNTTVDLVPYEDDIDFVVTTYLREDDPEPLFSGEGNLQLRPDLFVQASAAVEQLPVSPVAALFTGNERIRDLTDNLSFSTNLFMSTDFDRFSFTTSGVEFTDRDNRNNHARFFLSGNNSGFSLGNIDIAWNDTGLTGRAGLSRSDDNTLSGDLSLVYRETPYQLSASWDEDRGLFLKGSYGLTAFLQNTGRGLTFRLGCEDLPVPLQDNTSFVSMQMNGNYRDKEEWNAYLRRVDITGLPFASGENSLSVAGSADPDRLVLYRVAYGDDISTVGGSGALDMGLLNSSGGGWLELAGPDNRERYTLQLSMDTTLKADLHLTDAPIRRFTAGGLTGLVDGRVLMHGKADNPEVDLEAALKSGLFNGDPVSGSLTARYDGRRVTCPDLNLQYMNNHLEDVRLDYDLTAGTFEAGGSLRGAMHTETIAARIQLSGRSSPASSLRELPEVLKENIDGSAEIDRIRKGAEFLDDWSLTFASGKEGLHVEGGPETSLRADILPDKSFTLEFSEPLPLQGLVRGRLEKSAFEAELTDAVLEVKLLDSLLQIPQFRMTEGNARGSLRLSGALNDPEIWGTVTAKDIMAENPYVVDKIGPFDVVLEFDEKNLALRNVVMPAGSARAVADVEFNIDHWMTDTMEIDIQTLSRTGLHVVAAFGKAYIDGYMKGRLNITGDQNTTHLTGSLEVLSTAVTLRNMETPEAGPDPSGKFLSADVALTTGKGVEFLWPSENLPVLRTFAETGEQIDVIYDGTRDQYTIRGEVGVKGGQIYYVQRNFYIREGMILFNENQDKFDPILSVTAEIREVNREGEAAKIYLIVEENAFSTFQPRFESEPVMSTSEIFSLLGGQMFYASPSETMDLSQAVAMTGDFVGQFGILRTFEDRVKTVFNLDLFTFRTPFVSNILLDKVFPLEAEQQYSEPETLGKYLDNTTLFLGKYFGNDVFFQAILRLDFQEQVAEGIRSSSEMFLDTEITLEWKTPVTLINFSLFPDLTTGADNLFNPSLGLSWRYSY